MTEATLQRNIVNLLVTTYGRRIQLENNAPTMTAKTGKADLTMTLDGKALAIEVKHPDLLDPEGALRADQVVWLKHFVEAGGAALVTNDPTLDEVRWFLEEVEHDME